MSSHKHVCAAVRILDVSKHVMGQAFVHSLNVLLSNWGSHQGGDFENPCTLYALNIAVDTTIGE